MHLCVFIAFTQVTNKIDIRAGLRYCKAESWKGISLWFYGRGSRTFKNVWAIFFFFTDWMQPFQRANFRRPPWTQPKFEYQKEFMRVRACGSVMANGISIRMGMRSSEVEQNKQLTYTTHKDSKNSIKNASINFLSNLPFVFFRKSFHLNDSRCQNHNR